MKKLSTLLLLGLTVIFFAACEKPEDILRDLNGIFAEERTRYEVLLKQDSTETEVHGEKVSAALSSWTQVLTTLHSRVLELDRKLEGLDGEERAKVQPSLDVLRELLKGLLGRSVQHKLLVPSWTFAQARADQQRAEQLLSGLRSVTLKQFPLSVSPEPTLLVSVSVDEKVLDTKPECLSKVRDTFQHYRDSKCLGYFQETCGHQMRMSCLDQRFMDFRLNGNNCFDMVEKKPAGNSKDAVYHSVCSTLADPFDLRECRRIVQNADYYDPKSVGLCNNIQNPKRLTCVTQIRNQVYSRNEIANCTAKDATTGRIPTDDEILRCVSVVGTPYEVKFEETLTAAAKALRDQIDAQCHSSQPILR
jgi:hypothetical protein